MRALRVAGGAYAPFTLGMAGLALTSVAQFLLMPAIDARLGQDGVGTWAFLFQCVTAAGLVDLGITGALTKKLCAASDEDERLALRSSGVLILSGAGVAFAVILLVLCACAEAAMRSQPGYWLACAVFCVVGFVRWPFAIWRIDNLAHQRLAFTAAVDIVHSAGRPVAATCFVALHPSLLSLVAGYAAMEFLGIALHAARSRTALFRIRPSGRQVRAIVGLGVTYFATAVSVMASTYGMSVMIGIHAGSAKMAAFSTSFLLPTLLLRLGILPSMTAFPRLAAGRVPVRHVRALFGVTVFLAVGVAMLILGVNRWFVRSWMGEGYVLPLCENAALGAWIGSAIVRHGAYDILRASSDRLWPIAKLLMLEAILVLVLAPFVIPRLGIGWMFAGLACSQITAAVVAARMVRSMGASRPVPASGPAAAVAEP